MTTEKVNKTELAISLGIARRVLYYRKTQPAKDEVLRDKIIEVMKKHKAYGHKRVAMELKIGKNRAKRVMKLYGLVPERRRKNPPPKEDDQGKEPVSYINVTKLLCPIAPNSVWAGDFTYVKYKGTFIYLATIIDRFSREVVGFAVSRYHNKELVLEALRMAIANIGTVPIYFHSDQGSEYDSNQYTSYLKQLGVEISMSDKASPWQNGHKESFYSHYKFELDLKNADRFGSVGELIEAIYLQLHYYNTDRIHTALKMSPQTFRRLYESRTQLLVTRRLVVQKTGT
jgi:transposase InsO family protein